MLIAQKYFEYKKMRWKFKTIFNFTIGSYHSPSIYLCLCTVFPLSLFLFLQFWCSVKRGYFQSICNEIRKQWMESLGIKTWWRQCFPPFTFSRWLCALAPPQCEGCVLTLPEEKPEHVEGASAQQPLGKQHVWNFQPWKLSMLGA